MSALKGYRKLIIGLATIAAGVALCASGDNEKGWKLIEVGLAIVIGGNIIDKVIEVKNNKNGGDVK